MTPRRERQKEVVYACSQASRIGGVKAAKQTPLPRTSRLSTLRNAQLAMLQAGIRGWLGYFSVWPPISDGTSARRVDIAVRWCYIRANFSITLFDKRAIGSLQWDSLTCCTNNRTIRNGLMARRRHWVVQWRRWNQSDGNRFKYLAATDAIEPAFGARENDWSEKNCL